MDVLLNLAEKFGFQRVTSKLKCPIVFHCVPGSGKSTLIRELIKLDSRFKAWTLGVADPPNLSGAWIKRLGPERIRGDFDILDEYLLGEADTSEFYAVFGDPLQALNPNCLLANFIASHSHRFGKVTAALLRELDFEITASKEDSVQIAGIYSVDPRDTVIYHEVEVGVLLRAHGIEAFCFHEVIGKTFESVTFVTAENYPKDRVKSFICLTRHTKSLLILNPNAAYATT